MIELRPGSTGTSVMLLQIRLLSLGFDPNGIDGAYGPGTERAVRAFQDRSGLPVDGIVGATTAEALELNPDAEIPSGFDGVSVTAVSKMFSPHTPLKNIRQHLPNVLGKLVEADLRDQEMVLMALSTVRAETEGFAPINELPSGFNTNDGGSPFDKYDRRQDLGNQGPPDGERFRGRGFIQLTGRFNYNKFSAVIGQDLITSPELANDSTIASALLAAFIKDKETRIRQALMENDLGEARRLVNGGSHGLDRFTEAYRAGETLIPSNLDLRGTG